MREKRERERERTRDRAVKEKMQIEKGSGGKKRTYPQERKCVDVGEEWIS